jgi:hypothetical protein
MELPILQVQFVCFCWSLTLFKETVDSGVMIQLLERLALIRWKNEV